MINEGIFIGISVHLVVAFFTLVGVYSLCTVSVAAGPVDHGWES